MEDLTNKLKKSLSLSFFDKYVGYFLRFIATVIVARLVTPDDIGIFSVAFVVISLGHVIRDFGVAQFLIKEKEINQDKIVAAFTLMLIISWGLFILMYWARHPIADFYNKPELNEALQILSLIFLFAPFGSVRIALLRRDMNFVSLAKINIASYLSLQIVTVILAFLGWGYLALAWGQIAGVLATMLGTFVYYKLPFMMPRLKGIRGVMRFGINISATNVGESLASGSPDLILGRVLNMEAVGFFGRAQSLISLFKIAVQAAVWPVVLPYFSSKDRQGLSILEDYEKAIRYYTTFALPFLAVLGIASELMIEVLFGGTWLPASPIVKWLCIGAMLETCFPFLGPFLVALAHEKLNLGLQWVNTALIATTILIGSLHSLVFAAIGFVVAQLITAIVTMALVSKYTGFSIDYLGRALSKNIMLTIFVSLIAKSVLLVPVHNIYLQLAILAIILLTAWVSFIWMTDHPLRPFLKLRKI
ncbi:MAG: lipopolysaccharide biosynthesis protein [Gammaproteobacteria bacterium]